MSQYLRLNFGYLKAEFGLKAQGRGATENVCPVVPLSSLEMLLLLAFFL
jgi:hypothetical protein